MEPSSNLIDLRAYEYHSKGGYRWPLRLRLLPVAGDDFQLPPSSSLAASVPRGKAAHRLLGSRILNWTACCGKLVLLRCFVSISRTFADFTPLSQQHKTLKSERNISSRQRFWSEKAWLNLGSPRRYKSVDVWFLLNLKELPVILGATDWKPLVSIA